MSARPYEFITFDCYGTLIDWESGIREAFATTAAALGRPVDLDRALALYVDVEAQVEALPFRSYRAVLTETARRLGVQLGWPVPEDRLSFLADSVPAWRPFPDTNPALRRLAAAGYRLGILSNVDDGLLAWTRRHLAAYFEVVVTAQQVGSYKPAPGHFTAARSLIGGAPWLHAAQSYFHDVVPARAQGLPVAWINRKGAGVPAGGAVPDRVFPTLAGLADWLAP